MASKNHLHLYKRVKLTNAIVYRCMKPGCSHHCISDLIENKNAECPKCSEPFVLTKRLLHQKAYPVCQNCVSRNRKTRSETIAVDVLTQLLKKKGIEDVLP